MECHSDWQEIGSMVHKEMFDSSLPTIIIIQLNTITMTIQEIKQRTKDTAPHYFSSNTLSFFNQKLSDFKVKKLNDTEYLIHAPSYWNGRLMGKSMQIFNSITNDLKSTSFVDTDLLNN